MPKSASTALQLLMSDTLVGMEQCDLHACDTIATTTSAESLAEFCSGSWDSNPRTSRFAPGAFRDNNVCMLSSEDYFHLSASQLTGAPICGLVLLREPYSWVRSSVAFAMLVELAAAAEPQDLVQFDVPAEDSDAQLHSQFAWALFGYRQGLSNVRSWVEQSDWFDAHLYRPGIDLPTVLNRSLDRLGVAAHATTAPQRLRSSYPFAQAQLAHTLYRVAIEQFGATGMEAIGLARLALYAEPALLEAHLRPLADDVQGEIEALLAPARADFEQVLAELAPYPSAGPPPATDLRVLDAAFAVPLARTLIQTHEGLSIPPPRFDAQAYLNVNPDLAAHAATIDDPLGFALDHFVRYGALEGRPAPAADN